MAAFLFSARRQSESCFYPPFFYDSGGNVISYLLCFFGSLVLSRSFFVCLLVHVFCAIFVGASLLGGDLDFILPVCFRLRFFVCVKPQSGVVEGTSMFGSV